MDLERIQRDLASFADPATEVRVSDRIFTWTQDRETRQIAVVQAEGELPDVLFLGRRFRYAEFFASEAMADLRGLSETIPRLLAQAPGFVQDGYVEGRITLEDAPPGPASVVLCNLVNPSTDARKTKVVFLRGRAGDGKSVLLTRCAYEQALAYQTGNASWLYFYVDAQGSNLARIDEVMAKQTQDLRARFTYHAVSTLTRLGLLVPMIDGFDELLGVGGYRDAFSSLALFISRMSGRGALVASARSTFYQYTAFGQQAARLASDDLPLEFEIIPAELEPWTDEEVSEFLDRAHVGISLDQVREALGPRAPDVLSSPFMLASLAKYADLAGPFGQQGHLARRIIESIVEREMVEKLLDPVGMPLLTLEQHMRLLGALAEEMWWQETRQLDEPTFLTIAELICEEFGLEGMVAERFLNRMPTHALLSRASGPTRVFFRHEYYFGFFLGAIIAIKSLRFEGIDDLLGRAVLPTVVADEVAATLRYDGSGNVSPLMSAIADRRPSSVSAEVVNLNAGTVFAALIREFGDELEGFHLDGASFSGVDLVESSLRGVSFRKCTFAEVDFRGCFWRGVEMVDCELSLSKMSRQKRFEVSGLSVPRSVSSLRYYPDDGPPKDLYSPSEIRQALVQLGCPIEGVANDLASTEESRALIEQLDLFLRVVRRTLYFSQEDFDYRGVSLDRGLKDIFRMLQDSGLVVGAKRQIQGKRQMYRLTAKVDDIRKGESGIFASPEVRKLWIGIASV